MQDTIRRLIGHGYSEGIRRIPIVAPSERTSEPIHDSARAMIRVLLIEDDALMANLESVILEAAGFKVAWVETREAAANALEDAPPDVILSDLSLAIGNAQDTVRFLSGYSSRFPIVICSGSLDIDGLKATCMAAGVMSTVSKFDVPEPGVLGQAIVEAHAKFHTDR